MRLETAAKWKRPGRPADRFGIQGHSLLRLHSTETLQSDDVHSRNDHYSTPCRTNLFCDMMEFVLFLLFFLAEQHKAETEGRVEAPLNVSIVQNGRISDDDGPR